MRVGIYLRISEDKTGEELGVTRQREDAVSLAERRGWSVVDTYTDNDLSAAGRVQRPGFNRMIKDIRAGKLEVVIGWAFDRFLRNARDQLALLEACQEHSVVIALVQGSDIDPSTPAGELTATTLGSVARFEIRQKSVRQTRANVQRAEAGTPPPAGPVPFGFMPDRVTHHPKQAAAIARGYDDLLAGSSLAAIARRWNADPELSSGRVRTRERGRGTPSPWRAETVRRLLLSPRNAGIREYWPKGAKQPAVYAGTWEPLVPEETYRAAVELLTAESRRTAPPNPRHLLSGVAVCAVCGERMNAGTARPTYFAYRCRASLGHVGRRGDLVDDLVTDVVLHRLARADSVDLITPKVPQADVRALRTRANALRRKLETLATDFADNDEDDPDGAFTPSQVRAANRQLRRNLAEVEAQLTEAGRVNALTPLVGHASVKAVEQVWLTLDTDIQRTVIDTLVFIVLHPVGRGARKFDPASVWIKFRIDVE